MPNGRQQTMLQLQKFLPFVFPFVRVFVSFSTVKHNLAMLPFDEWKLFLKTFAANVGENSAHGKLFTVLPVRQITIIIL